MSTVPTLKFHNGLEIPQIGYGVFRIPDEETKAAVSTALEVGYRHLDTAMIYGNEAGVGEAIAASGVAREDLFVTTKCWNADQGQEAARVACQASLERLGLDYLDLYLIHWPTPARSLYVDTWRAFESLNADGLVRTIGVSNFQPEHLQRLFEETDIVPAINQIELHPWLPQHRARAFHAEHGILTEAWSPLAAGGDFLADEAIGAIAAKHDVSPAQVILRWHLDQGNVIIPKSVNRDRMASNLDLFAISLDEQDLKLIDSLDNGTRVGPDPDEFNGT